MQPFLCGRLLMCHRPGALADFAFAGIVLRLVGHVDRYTQALDEHSILVREYSTLLPAFNAKVELHNVAIRQFNEKCADRPYLRKDWLQLK